MVLLAHALRWRLARGLNGGEAASTLRERTLRGFLPREPMLRELSRRELAFRGLALSELVPCGLALREFYSVG